MNSKNPFLVAVEDDIIKLLEADTELPVAFCVQIPDSYLFEILRNGVYTKSGKLPYTASGFVLQVAGHRITIKSETAVVPKVEH